MLVARNGVHTARAGARALQLQNRPIRANLGAAAAFDAFFLIDHGFTVYDGNSVPRADLLAGMRQTALTAVRHTVLLFRAGIAGKFNDIDKRRIIVLLRDCALVDSHRNRRVLVHRAQRQADGKAQALSDNRALQKNGVAVLRRLSMDNLVRQALDSRIIAALICQARNLCKYLSPDIRHRCINAPHFAAPSSFVAGHISYRHTATII